MVHSSQVCHFKLIKRQFKTKHLLLRIIQQNQIIISTSPLWCQLKILHQNSIWRHKMRSQTKSNSHKYWFHLLLKVNKKVRQTGFLCNWPKLLTQCQKVVHELSQAEKPSKNQSMGQSRVLIKKGCSIFKTSCLKIRQNNLHNQ